MVGVSACRRIGVSACRRVGVSAYRRDRRIGVSACRRVGVMEWWSDGVMESWSVGVSEYRHGGVARATCLAPAGWSLGRSKWSNVMKLRFATVQPVTNVHGPSASADCQVPGSRTDRLGAFTRASNPCRRAGSGCCHRRYAEGMAHRRTCQTWNRIRCHVKPAAAKNRSRWKQSALALRISKRLAIVATLSDAVSDPGSE